MMDRSIDVISRKRVFESFFSVDEVEIRYQRPDGSMSQPVERLSAERGDAVGVLIYVRSTDCFILVKQFRYPTLRHGEPYPVEIIAGSLDRGETPEAAARREAAEEVRVTLETIEKACEIYSSPGGLSEMVSIFIAEIESYEANGEIGGLQGEDVEILVMNRKLIYDQLDRGEIRDAKTQVALYRFMQKHPI